ncbi:hypothetical protein D3C72_2351160 [compost metagenome]
MPVESSTPPREAELLRTRPDRMEMYRARKMSSNMMMPRIISVSGLAVRLRSTSTLATIALEEMVVMPVRMRVSFRGKPAASP